MQNKKIKLVSALILVFGVISMQAQNTLFVKEKSGTQTSYSLSNIQKLTFASENIIVNKKDGSINTFAFTNIRYLNFGNDGTTGISRIEIEGNKTLILYPNPVTDQLNIQFKSASSEKVQLQIVNIQGRIILQEDIKSQSGINYATISVSQLLHGLYFCRLQNGDKPETIKFLKN